MSQSDAGNALMDLEFPVEVWLASEEVELETLVALEPGEVLPLDRDPDGPVDLVVNGSVVASGELVVVDGHFGFRVTESTLHKLATMDASGTEGDGGREP
jgi:flagellar motor switch protein FliN/FliY